MEQKVWFKWYNIGSKVVCPVDVRTVSAIAVRRPWHNVIAKSNEPVPVPDLAKVGDGSRQPLDMRGICFQISGAIFEIFGGAEEGTPSHTHTHTPTPTHPTHQHTQYSEISPLK